MKIEFFHDVICSFCFPMSYRMRQVEKALPDVEIIHRSFALVRDETDFNRMFGSRNAAKAEILQHWEHANQNDDLHRFNIEGMRKENFLFPCSMPALMACKTAYIVGGDKAYWDVFDALQYALFVEHQNVESLDVIEHCVKACSVDFAQWKMYYGGALAQEALEADFELVQQYATRSVPCLVIDEQSILNGAQPLDVILKALTSASAPSIEGRVCRLGNDGRMNCN